MGGGTSSLNFETGTIWHADNLELMRGLNSETVDLVYLDPPFNSAKNYKGTGKASKQGFADNWSEKQLKEWDMLKGVQDNIDLLRTQEWWSLMELVKDKHSTSMYYYLSFMAVRILQIKRIMKPTASIYLHCDPTSNSYLRMLMDYIFGSQNMRNEIVWSYNTRTMPTKWFARKHDTIYFYTKSDHWTFNTDDVRIPYREESLSQYNKVDDLGRRYKPQTEGKRTYLNELGQPCPSVWDIQVIGSRSKERTGWATQKPLTLLTRVIEASSKPGDIVFDPFCGCATTLLAAANKGRRFIGCDVDEEVVDIALMRWEDQIDLLYENKDKSVQESINITSEIPERTDNVKADEPPIEFTRTDVRQLYGKTLYGEQEGYCPGCKEHEKFKNMDVDHMVPRSRGGTNDLENLQLLCRKCNASKGSKTMEEWQNPALGVD